jgi:rfaE bifunctional protein kinase chain/domain
MTVKSAASNWLEACLSKIPQARVAVFGDFCLDAYWMIDPGAAEKSIETGRLVRRVRSQRYSLGGAGNIVANLVDLGVGQVRAVGLVGQDLFGAHLLELLRRGRVNCDGLLASQPDWQTLVYSKPYIEDAEQDRLDFGGFNVLADATAEALAAELSRSAATSDVVILNQQVPAGVSTPAMIERLNQVIADHPKCIFIIDSRHRPELYRGGCLKLNAHEAARMLGQERPLDERIPADQARRFTQELARRTGRAVFLTRGENGLLACDGRQVDEIPGIQIVTPTDPVGAGDTCLSAIAAVLASGGRPVEAARLANIAAAITVRKLFTTGTATPAEIRAVGPTPDYVYLPELADDPRQARYVAGSEIELIRDLPAGPAIRHAVFDHDGTISTLRQGWEAIMEPMMIRAILGPRYQTADEALYHKVVAVVRRFIDKTTGFQTLVQMQGLVELVQQFGCTPPEQVLDMHGYKQLYNKELLAMVRQRTDKLRRGELSRDDFQIKSTRPLLEALHRRGIKLYLASGTDHAEVVAEAEALGYAALFEGRIFGAVGDIAVEAKQVVLERLFREQGLSGPEVATFGDGPVEMRLTHQRGGVAVGVASDEVRRFGLNPAKRTRLIRSGADLLVPDFSQLDKLLAVLRLPSGDAKRD